MSRKVPFNAIVDGLTPFLVTRIIITGSGKVGAENGSDETEYQILNVPIFEKEVGLSTMVNRPLINNARMNRMLMTKSIAVCTSSSATLTCLNSASISKLALPA